MKTALPLTIKLVLKFLEWYVYTDHGRSAEFSLKDWSDVSVSSSSKGKKTGPRLTDLVN